MGFEYDGRASNRAPHFHVLRLPKPATGAKYKCIGLYGTIVDAR